MEYLDKNYLQKAMNFYKLDNQEEIFNLLEKINNNKSLEEILCNFYNLLYVNKTDDYKKLKKFDKDKNNSTELNKILILMGYNLHLRTFVKRKFDFTEIKKQIFLIHNTLIKDNVTFNDLQWIVRFIRGVVIQVGVLQYEVLNEIPYYLEEYSKNVVVKIHIPSNTKLLNEEVENSLSKVEDIIEKYYQELNTNNILFYTESWLLSPELINLLDVNSNILKFQSHFRLIAVKENIEDFNRYVFNGNRKNTSLQKALKKYLDTNKILHIGIGLLQSSEYTIYNSHM